MKTQPRIAIVDVCGTLYDTNTTAGFVRFHHRRVRNVARAGILNAATSRQLPLRVLLVALGKLLRFDILRSALIYSLIGESVAELKISAVGYVDALRGEAIPQVHELVDRYRSEGRQLVLASNSLHYVISEISSRLGGAFVASEVFDVDGRSAGRLSKDITGRKRAALESLLNVNLSDIDYVVVTDNRTDMPLLPDASEATIVCKGPVRSWMKVANAKFLHH